MHVSNKPNIISCNDVALSDGMLNTLMTFGKEARLDSRSTVVPLRMFHRCTFCSNRAPHVCIRLTHAKRKTESTLGIWSFSASALLGCRHVARKRLGPVGLGQFLLGRECQRRLGREGRMVVRLGTTSARLGREGRLGRELQGRLEREGRLFRRRARSRPLSLTQSTQFEQAPQQPSRLAPQARGRGHRGRCRMPAF